MLKKLLSKDLNTISNICGFVSGYTANVIATQVLNRYPYTTEQKGFVTDLGKDLISASIGLKVGTYVKDTIYNTGKRFFKIEDDQNE